MHLPKDWGHQFSALLCNLHVHNISSFHPSSIFKMNIQILRHFGKKKLSDSRHFKLDTSHVIRHFKLLDPPILVLLLLPCNCPYGSYIYILYIYIYESRQNFSTSQTVHFQKFGEVGGQDFFFFQNQSR